MKTTTQHHENVTFYLCGNCMNEKKNVETIKNKYLEKKTKISAVDCLALELFFLLRITKYRFVSVFRVKSYIKIHAIHSYFYVKIFEIKGKE